MQSYDLLLTIILLMNTLLKAEFEFHFVTVNSSNYSSPIIPRRHIKPTTKPIYKYPTKKPNNYKSTSMPIKKPANKPVYHYPSRKPIKKFPSNKPVHLSTTNPTPAPTIALTSIPSTQPSSKFPEISSIFPSETPVVDSTFAPSVFPSFNPSLLEPTITPAYIPSVIPTLKSTAVPSFMPSDIPSVVPILKPSTVPSYMPSAIPTHQPSMTPTFMPAGISTFKPTISPTSTFLPSIAPIGSSGCNVCNQSCVNYDSCNSTCTNFNICVCNPSDPGCNQNVETIQYASENIINTHFNALIGIIVASVLVCVSCTVAVMFAIYRKYKSFQKSSDDNLESFYSSNNYHDTYSTDQIGDAVSPTAMMRRTVHDENLDY